jgi:DNA polymerase-3 subunit alpha
MDFLGLKTLTVIHDATEMIRERHGVEIDFDSIDLDDSEVYKLLRSGRVAGVFQFESPLGTDMLHQLRADRFNDLVATNALVRPGPLDSGMHQVYIRRKRGLEEVRYALPDLQEVLEPTYGVILCWRAFRWPKRMCCERRWARRTPS